MNIELYHVTTCFFCCIKSKMGNQKSIPYFELYQEWLTNNCKEAFFGPLVEYVNVSLQHTPLTAEKIVEVFTPLKTPRVVAIEYDRDDDKYHVSIVLLREYEDYYRLEMIDSMADDRQVSNVENAFWDSIQLFEQKHLAKPLYFYPTQYMYGQDRMPPQLEEQKFLKHCSESSECELKEYANAIAKHKGEDSILWSHCIARDLLESGKTTEQWSIETYQYEDCNTHPFELIDIAATNANNVYKELPKGTNEKDIVPYYVNLLDAQGRAPKMFDVAFKQNDGEIQSTFLGEKKKLVEGIVSFVNNDSTMRTLQKRLNNVDDKTLAEEAYMLCIDKTTFEVTRCYQLNVPTNAEDCTIESMPVITYDVPLEFIRNQLNAYNDDLKDAPDNSFFICMHTHPRFCTDNDWDTNALRSFPSAIDVDTHLKVGVLQQMQYYGEECAVVDVILSHRDVFLFSTHKEVLKEIRELNACVQKTAIERGKLLTKWITKRIVEDIARCKQGSFRQKKDGIRNMEGDGHPNIQRRRVLNYFVSRKKLNNYL